MRIDLIQGFRSLLLPRSCAGCQTPIDSGDLPFCPPCLEGLPRLSPPWGVRSGTAFDQVVSPFRYEAQVRDLILALKYQGRLSLCSFFAQEIAQAVSSRLGSDPAVGIVPVPLHPTRLRERGFNQAQILARKLGDRLRLPVVAQLLQRRRPTLPQADLSRSERLRNMRGAFQILRRVPFKVPGTVLLVDDVYTTGATADACARVLRRAGATKVIVATVAHG